MGLFRRKKKKEEEVLAPELPVETKLEEEPAWGKSREECVGYIRSHCERIMESVRLSDEAKTEYQVVSSCLLDIQRIDRFKEKTSLLDAARQIVTINRAIERYRGTKSKLTHAQYRLMERYEEDMPEQLKRMEEEEKHYLEIKSDLRYLEQEKASIQKEKREIRGKQKYLKKLSIITFVLVIILFLLFLAISYVFLADMAVPYMMTIALAAASAAFIFLEARKNRAGMERAERKGNKAVLLLNKVKIKYVNTTNLLDYYYEKYGAQGTEELRYQFQEYKKAKEDAADFRENTEKLKACQEILIKELKDMGVKDCEVWLHQTAALLDEKEMVEVRHTLNQRRQKLREQMDYNEEIKQGSLSSVQKFLEEQPSYKAEMIKVLGDYRVIL